ncbi:type I restriction enzyme, S subunit [Enterococcus sp. AZ150]|uniref:restriction endonuclease subunit S n=1 Tax=Enterococcus sp. AZ150 TaxID=2774866 RepID=UPI003F251DA6
MSIKQEPVIRFSEFTDEWEQYKLKELYKPSKKKNNIGEYNQKDILAASLGTELIPKTTFFGLKSTEESVKNYRIVDKGDLIYTKSPIKGFPNGIIRANKGSVGIVPSLYCVYELKKVIDPSIIQLYFEDKYRLDAYLFPLVNVGARNNVNITDSEFLEGNLIIPKSIREQKKIVDFIEKLNNIIILHQRELESFKAMKQNLLNKMFPKNGESVPEIRFPEFTDPWEQRKLRDLSDSFEYGLNAAAKEYDGKNKYLRITDIDEDSHLFKQTGLTSPDIDLSDAENFKLKVNDILFARTGASVGKTYRYDSRDGLVYYAGFLIRARIRNEFDAEFIYQNTLTKNYNQYIQVTSQRSGQPGVNAQEYAKFELFVPSLEEQQKIGQFFKQLDDTIALHQRELDTLEEMKKTLLKEMFI